MLYGTCHASARKAKHYQWLRLAMRRTGIRDDVKSMLSQAPTEGEAATPTPVNAAGGGLVGEHPGPCLPAFFPIFFFTPLDLRARWGGPYRQFPLWVSIPFSYIFFRAALSLPMDKVLKITENDRNDTSNH